MNVNLYSDVEGNLIPLCRACAERWASFISWVRIGGPENACELCDELESNPEAEPLANVPY